MPVSVDWADRLTQVTSNNVVVLQNWYDAFGRRIAKNELVNGQMQKWLYLYDGWNIVGVMNGNGQLLETYTRGVGLAGDIGTLVAVTHHSGSAVTPGTYYVHNNHRGDVLMARSGTTTVGSYTYSAFGLLTSTSGADVCRFKFSSKERDASTGFSYYGYRFYAPQWQRWLNRDPLNELGFQAVNEFTQPINFREEQNLYKFAQNNPFIKIDPVGLLSKEVLDALEDAYRMARRKWFACVCLDSVTAFYCRCIKSHLTDPKGMASCICAANPDSNCEHDVECAMKKILGK